VDFFGKISQLVGALGATVESPDPVTRSFVQWASRIQEQIFTRWHHVAATGIPCAKMSGRTPCTQPAVQTCRFCRQPTCLHHAAVAQNGELWCLPCMAKAEAFLRVHAQGQKAAPRAVPDDAAVRLQKLEVLGLKDAATAEEIHAQFRKLSLKFHPDRQVGASADKKRRAETRYRAITEAYHWLQSHERKAA
jgi:hypothetical protein